MYFLNESLLTHVCACTYTISYSGWSKTAEYFTIYHWKSSEESGGLKLNKIIAY